MTINRSSPGSQITGFFSDFFSLINFWLVLNTLQYSNTPISSVGWCINHSIFVPHTTCGSFCQLGHAELGSSACCQWPVLCSIFGNWLSCNLYSALGEIFLQSFLLLVTLPTVFLQSFWGSLNFWRAGHLGGKYAASFLSMKLCNSFQRNTESIAAMFEELCFPLSTLISSWTFYSASRPAVQGLGWFIWTHMKDRKHSGGVVSVCVACQPEMEISSEKLHF